MFGSSSRTGTGRAVFPLLALFGLIFSPAAGAAERGLPLVTTYPAELHRAGPQIFDVAQDSRGILYFGTLHGLATYDGAAWRLQKLPDEQLAMAVASNASGEVAIGMVDDLGYFESTPKGEVFRSLRSQIPEKDQQFGNVRSICATAAGFLYLTEQSVLLWDGKRVSVAARYERQKAPRGCLAQGSEAFLRGPLGLERLDLTTFALAPGGITERLMLIMSLDGGKILALTRGGKVLLVENGQANPYAPELAAWLAGKTIVGGARLFDGRIVIATLQHGIAIVAADGRLETTVGIEAGIPDSLINDVLVDREGALWLAMEGPIARVDLTSPVTSFDSRVGLRGSVGDVTRHKGRLYAASTHGMFAIAGNGHATRVEGIESPWRLISIDDELLVSAAKGIHVLDARGRLVDQIQWDGVAYDMVRSRADPSRVWMAEDVGLTSVRRVNGKWQQEGIVAGVGHDLSSVIEHEGSLWVGTVFEGIFHIEKPRTPQQKVTQYGSGEMNVFIIAGRPVFVRATGGILEIAPDGKLVPDSRLGHLAAPSGFFIVAEDRRGAVWINSTPPRYFEPRADGGYATEGKPLVSVTAADIQNLRVGTTGTIWFASDKGLFQYDPNAGSAPVGPQPAPFIRRVIAGEKELPFTRSGPPSTPLELRHDFGRMRIEYAPVSYRPGTAYQYRLDPVDAEWSSWSEETFIDYTSLEPNDYTFRVRARGPAMVPGNEASWSFSVLPPWYATRVAWAFWIVTTLASIAVLIRLRTRTLHRQAEMLRARVDEQTAELHQTVRLLEAANAQLETLSLEDELTGIANRRYFERALTDEWNRARRREHYLALILLDLDHFKDLNDRLGHQAGDECLRQLGAFLQETIRRSGEVVARYGGEEFAILLPGASASAAERVAETLRAGIERLAVSKGTDTSCVTASCGVAAMIPASGVTGDDLVASADRALYEAKNSGRNCVRVATETPGASWLRNVSA